MALALSVSGCAALDLIPMKQNPSAGGRYWLAQDSALGDVLLAGCPQNNDGNALACATLTAEPADGEAWLFEARMRVVSGEGIPLGRRAHDLFVVGDREHCETVRVGLQQKPHLFYAKEQPPTAPCRGPYYFRKG